MLKVGFSRVDITPPLGTFMAGYFEPRYAKGVLDPIYLNAIAFSDGDETAVIITADMCGIEGSAAKKIRARISKSTGVCENNIIVGALHQHTSIALQTSEINNVFENYPYFESLMTKFSDVAVMAVNDMSEATLYTAETQATEKISFIRRYLMKDGTKKTNARPPEAIERPLGEPDNTVRLLRFVREGKGEVALVNFQTHPDVIGGEYISADWPGFARTYIEKELEGVSCILLNGCQGDTNHHNHMLPYRNNGIEKSKSMGRVIANTVFTMWSKAKKYEGDVCVRADIAYSSQRVRTDGVELYDECVAKLKGILDGTVERDSLDHVGGRGGARRIVNIRTSPIFKHVPVSVISLGGIAFVGFGGEPFTHYAEVLRTALPDKYILTMCCANGYEGYLPTASAFSEGGYEASSSPYFPTLEEELTTLAVETVNKLDK